MSEKLEKARLYEIEEAKNIPQEEKPAFHVSAPVGWINDPNGFSVFKGKVHLFYQYHPYSRDWGYALVPQCDGGYDQMGAASCSACTGSGI